MQPISTTPLTPPQSNGVQPSVSEGARADEREKAELIAWYSSPEFTRRLLEHMHKAKKKALLEDQERRDK